MPANTPWCPRCGDWRGYMERICKGCMKVEEHLLTLPATTTDPKSKQTVPVADASPDQRKEINRVRMELTGQRFAFVSEKRTEREAYTQQLEELVDQNVDMLKSLAYQWGQMRPNAKLFKFSNVYALEMTQAMELALSELGAVSLELSKFTNNAPVHEERMQRVMSWMEVLGKFLRPDATALPSVPEEEADAEQDDDGEDA